MEHEQTLSAFAAVITIFVAGCHSDPALIEFATTQGKQAFQVDKIAAIIKQQKEYSDQIETLQKKLSIRAKQLEEVERYTSANTATLKKLKKKPLGASRESQLRAAIILAQYDQSSIRKYAISILGHLGGENAEKYLIEQVEKSTGDTRYLINALIQMKSRKVLPILIRYLKSNDPLKLKTAATALKNRNLSFFTKNNIPFIEQAITRIDSGNSSRNIYTKRNLIMMLLRLDQDKGTKYLCKAIKETPSSRMRRYTRMLSYNGIALSFKNWDKITKAIGVPSSQKDYVFESLLSGIQRAPDYRYTDTVLTWANVAKNSIHLRTKYISVLHSLNDPKAAKTLLDMCNDNPQYSIYLNKYPGIIKRNNEFLLVDNNTMNKLMKTRNEAMKHIVKREKNRK